MKVGPLLPKLSQKKLAYFILRHRGVFSVEKLLISYEIEKAVSQFALSDGLATFMPVA